MSSDLLTVLPKIFRYKSWSGFFFRTSIVSMVSVLMMYMGIRISGNLEGNDLGLYYIKVIIVFNLLSEGNILLDNILERFYPVPKRLSLRILFHILFSSIFAFVTLRYFSMEFADVDIINLPLVQLMITFGLFFLFILIVISISIRITDKWVASERENDDLKRAKLKSDYNALQDQLNPHFLFNNLSVLKSMIKYDPENAVEFTQNFTDVYRYVLQGKERVLVPLEEELEFINAYLGLHQERLGEGLVYKLNVDEEYLEYSIPPLSLQLLVENAIKHNIASKENPLELTIETRENQLIVGNNIQKKESTYSTQSGLANLKKRFGLLSHKNIVINNDEHKFEVILPLFDRTKE